MRSVEDAWGSDPTYGEVLDSAKVAALWGSFSLAAPLFLVGARLASPDGFALSATELVLAVFIGTVIGGSLLGLGAWAAAFVAVPGGFLLRPAFGVRAAAVVAVVLAGLLLGLAGFEIRLAADAVSRAIETAGGPQSDALGWVVLGCVVGGLAWAGIVGSVSIWLRGIALWVGLGLTLYLMWRLVSADVSFASAPSGRFLGGVDLVATGALVLAPALPALVRFAGAPTVAASVTMTSFAAPALLLLFVGASAAAVAPTGDPVDLLLVAAGASASAGAMVAIALWVVAALGDQPYLYVYSAVSYLGALQPRTAPRLLTFALVVPAIAIGAVIDPADFADYVVLTLSVVAPVYAVILADFFALRAGSYDSDELYRTRGAYSGVNVLGVTAAVAGFATYHAIVPAGPAGWQRVVRDLLPAGRSIADRVGDLPPGGIAFLVAFVLYAGLGRWLVREEIPVSRISGRL